MAVTVVRHGEYDAHFITNDRTVEIMLASARSGQRLQEARNRSHFERAWQRAQACLFPITSAERMWERLLTEGDRQRLGGDLEKAYRKFGMTAGMWMKLRDVTYEEAVLHLAVQIGFLAPHNFRWLQRELGIVVDDPVNAMEKAISDGHLVMVESPREVHWEMKIIPIDWHRLDALWDLICALCRSGKSGKSVDRCEFGDSEDVDYLSKLKYRMVATGKFPLTLADQIVPAGRGMVRLKLPPKQIRIFEQNTAGSLQEWKP